MPRDTRTKALEVGQSRSTEREANSSLWLELKLIWGTLEKRLDRQAWDVS